MNGRASAAAFALALCAACQPADTEQAQVAAEPDAAADALSITTQDGPVQATVTLAPAAPRLGDALTLTLAVQAQPGVRLDMPVFGEALGRFRVRDFATENGATEDGGAAITQRYRLETPMSGPQRIPGLRVEYLDERDGPSDAYRELLTDELAFAVASVLPEGAISDELLPPRPALPEDAGGWLPFWWPWAVAGIGGLAALILAAFLWQRRALARAQLTAYDRAMRRLQGLERRGWPAGDAADAWYVELSDITRRYVEDRYAVRAPELTTEEFLLEARRAAALSHTHRQLLSAFLAHCDRVKFARYSPAADESREALETVQRFLDETRLPAVADAADAGGAGGGHTPPPGATTPASAPAA